MSRRKERGELDIGSDSFLDIIANMVGILIILIVLAGLQVKDIPLAKLLSSAPAEPPTPKVVEAPEPVDDVVSLPPKITEAPADDVAEAVMPPVVAVAERPLPAAPAADLAARLQEKLVRTQAELARTDETIASLEERFRMTRERSLALQQQHRQLETALDESTSAIDQRRAAYDQTQGKLNAIKGDYLNLQAAVEKARRERPRPQEIKHSLTAVSQEVLGEEWHFRIEGNHIAYVPIRELIERVQSEMKTRQEALLRHSRYQGEIGPIEGFTMQYTMEKQSLSIVDELRYGQGIMRIGLAEWRIDPEPGFRGETLEQALKPLSRFQRQLQMIAPGTTVTFWVYPDAFESFRVLQAYARDKGYTVAGRPLPPGVPISGSPQGTRSAGQ